MSFGAFRLSERQTAQMISAATKVVPVRSSRIVHVLALGETDQRNVDGEHQPADRGDDQALPMIVVGRMAVLAMMEAGANWPSVWLSASSRNSMP